MCGEIQVPEDHLDVCRVCNATGQNCRIDENSKAGPGIRYECVPQKFYH